MYFITYVVVPMLAGIVAVWGPVLERRANARVRKLVGYPGRIGIALFVCGVLNWFELMRILGELNKTGGALYFAILVSQLGGGLLFGLGAIVDKRNPGAPAAKSALGKLRRLLQVLLGLIAIVTALAMLAVRGQALGIFG